MTIDNAVFERTASSKKTYKMATDASYYSNCNPGLYISSGQYSQHIIF